MYFQNGIKSEKKMRAKFYQKITFYTFEISSFILGFCAGRVTSRSDHDMISVICSDLLFLFNNLVLFSNVKHLKRSKVGGLSADVFPSNFFPMAASNCTPQVHHEDKWVSKKLIRNWSLKKQKLVPK